MSPIVMSSDILPRTTSGKRTESARSVTTAKAVSCNAFVTHSYLYLDEFVADVAN